MPAAAAIFSLLKNHPGQRLKIYLLVGNADRGWITPLLQMIENSGSEAVLKVLDDSLFKHLKLNLHFTPATYFRILAADLFEEDKIIYLDSDLLVTGSLMEVWNTELENYPIAAVHDPFVNDLERLELMPEQGYFNSGVMLLNLDRWRAMGLGQKVLDYIKTHPERIQFADQCGFNAILKGDWKKLAPKWNVQTAFTEADSNAHLRQNFSVYDLQEAMAEPKVVHFTGVLKPWNLGSKHPFKALFWKYLNESPFRRNLPLNFSIPNLLKSFFPVSVKKYYWRYMNRKQGKVAVS